MSKQNQLSPQTIKNLAETARADPLINRWLSAFATCAIEGNQAAIEMLDLWEKDREKFMKELLEKWIPQKAT